MRRPNHAGRRLVSGLGALASTAIAATGGMLTLLEAGNGVEPAPPWHVVGLPFQTKPFTHFEVTEIDGHRVLRVDADRSYGILLHPLSGVDRGVHHLSWRWRVDVPNDRADLRQRNSDDVAAEVCVGFDLPLDPVPFVDRQLLRVARLANKDRVPAAVMCYVWDSHLPAGTVLNSVFTRRIRMIVLRGTGTPVADWRNEVRDVNADFLRLFGDEATTVPPIIGVAVAADADNTQGRSVAYVADVALGR